MTALHDSVDHDTRDATPGRVRGLVVAATGGHLEQAIRISQLTLPEFTEIEFVTFDDPQSRSLLEGEKVHFVPRIPPRGGKEALAAMPAAKRLVRQGGYDHVLSTGSAVAVPYLMAAVGAGIATHYVESAARSTGPSLTGRIVQRIPGINLYTQYPVWSDHRWQYRGAIFDKFTHETRLDTPAPASRIVVTLGTMRGFPFERAIRSVTRLLGDIATPDVEVLWQVGDAPVGHLGIDGVDMIPAKELRSAMVDADLVIAHAGIGTCLQALESGHVPVLLPRRREHGEHIDDHQLQIAAELNRRWLSVSRDPDALTAEDVWLARSARVRSDNPVRSFELRQARETDRRRGRVAQPMVQGV